MDLNIFKKDETPQVEHFWSLVLTHGWIQAGIWRVLEERAEIVAEGSSVAFEEDNEESLVSAADGTLSSSASNITINVPEPNKVVFGLPISWVEGGSISPAKLNLLKKLSEELELAPAGFVVIPEALVHFIKSKEGSPLHGLLVGVSDQTIEISLVQNGKVLGSTEVSRSVSLGADVSEGLTKLPLVSQYPSRIILYSLKAADLDDARQNILETDWKEVKVNFLHTPKVEVLAEDAALSAVSLAGAAEVGQAKTVVTRKQEEVIETAEEEAGHEDLGESLEDASVLGNPEVAAPSAETGFVQDADVAEFEKEEPQYALPQEEIAKHDNIRSTDFAHAPQYQIPNQRGKSLLGGVLGIFKGVKLPKFGNMSSGGRKRSTGVLVLIGLAIFLVAGAIAYWFLPKATVTIYVAPKALEKSVDFTASPVVSSVDTSKNIIPAQVKEVEVSQEKTTSTTGAKLTGERAKGVVTITNASGGKSLKSGTVMTGPNSLKFTLNEDTTVASASSAAKPSQTNAAISAGDIGAQYNLASGTEFSIGNFSKLDIVATNDQAFSGGTSREVSAVSETDRTNLEKELSQELIQKAITQAQGGLSESEVLVTEAAIFTASNREFSHKVGEETSTLKLNLSGKVKLLIIPKTSLNELIMAKMTSDVPQGFALKESQLEISFKPKEAEKTSTKTTTKTTKTEETPSSSLAFTASVSANLLPQVNPDDIRQKISGKYPSFAKEYLSTIAGFTRAEISQSIKFPGVLGTLPRVAKNINVEVAAER